MNSKPMAAMTLSVAMFLGTCIVYALHGLFLSPLVPIEADTIVNLLAMPALFGVVSIAALGASPPRLGIARDKVPCEG